MKKLIPLLLIPLLLNFCSKDEDENTNDNPANFTVSQGTVVGAIRISFTKDPDVSSVIVDRMEPNGTWVTITGTSGSFDDIHNYANGIPPGEVYNYRIKNDYPNDAPYSAVKSGYAYNILPIEKINISSTATTHTLIWNAGNHNSFQNESELFFHVMRSTDSTKEFKEIARVGEDRSYLDDISGDTSLQGIPLYYRIDIHCSFHTLSPYGSGGIFETEKVEGKIVATQ